jgi:hypothetical protein
MLPEMVGRKDAVAVKKNQVGSASGLRAVIAAAGGMKSPMLLGHKTNRERNRPGKLVDHVGRMIDRPVVRDDDFERRIHATLQRQRQQRAPQVLWTLKRRNDHRDFRLGRQSDSLPARRGGAMRNGEPSPFASANLQ